MARGTKTKSKGISLEELMQAQERMMSAGELSEKQLEIAKEQLSKLDTIAKAAVINDLEVAKEESDIRKIIARRAVPGSVGLVDVKNEIKNLSGDLKKELPKFLQGKTKKAGKEEEKELTEAQRNAKLTKLAEVIGEKVRVQKGGSLNETLTGKNRSTFEQFIKETERRDTLLAEASEDQREIFKQIEDTLIRLQEAGSEDSRDLRKELERLRGAMQETEDTGAKKALTGLAERTSENAAVGVRGNQGSFGDALQALLGRKEVLKKGMSRNEAGDTVNAQGEKVDRKEAVMGRVAGAGSIIGNMMMERFERGFEDKRSEKAQNFLDTFRSNETRARPNILQGQQNQLMGKKFAGKIEARAKGGPILKGRPYLVGEKGPELIVPKNDGQVNPLPQAQAKENVMFSDAGSYRADDAAGPFAKSSEKIVKAIKELTDVVKEQGGMGPGGIPLPLPGTSAAGKTPKGGGATRAGRLGSAAKNVKPGSPVVMGLSLIAGYFGMSMIDDMEEKAKAERTAKYDEMIASGDPEKAAKGQFMKEQEMSTWEKLGNIKKQYDELQSPERQERLKDAPWYTRYLGIGEESAVAPSLRPPVGPEIASRSAAVQDLRASASTPVIINAPTTVNAPTSKGDNTVTTVMRAPVRSEDNAFNNYMNRIYNPF